MSSTSTMSSTHPSPSRSFFSRLYHTYCVSPLYDLYSQFLHLNKRSFLHHLLSLLLIVSTALMLFRLLVLVSGTPSPVVVVVSGSMSPLFYRGDILVLWFGDWEFDVGEIVVFQLKGKETPIVHRVIEMHERPNTFIKHNGSTAVEGPQIQVLTKGDHNQYDDRAGIYNGEEKQFWLKREELKGRTVGYVPDLGWITIYLTENPIVKFILIGVMGIVVIISKDQ